MPDEVIDEFYATCDALNSILKNLGAEAFSVGEKCAENCNIDVFLLDYASVHPKQVLDLLPAIGKKLRELTHYWRVRIWLSTSGGSSLASDTCIWLEVDRYETFTYSGKKFVEIFDDIWVMYAHFWGQEVKREMREATESGR